jgi:transcriptional regulator with XRE-family HTH domain
LRLARATAGLSQAQLARRAGVTQPLVSWVERGERGVSIEVACRLALAAGCDLGVKVFPGDGVSLRDSGQLQIAHAIVATASSTWHVRMERPVSDSDRRAADLVLEGRHEVLHIEIERTLIDFQAQLRAATLKREALSDRYTQPVRLILAVPDRRSTRASIRQLGTLLERAFPLRSRAIRRVIASGEQLGGDGILFWPTVRTRAPAA